MRFHHFQQDSRGIAGLLAGAQLPRVMPARADRRAARSRQARPAACRRGVDRRRGRRGSRCTRREAWWRRRRRRGKAGGGEGGEAGGGDAEAVPDLPTLVARQVSHEPSTAALMHACRPLSRASLSESCGPCRYGKPECPKCGIGLAMAPAAGSSPARPSWAPAKSGLARRGSVRPGGATGRDFVHGPELAELRGNRSYRALYRQ